MEPKEQGETSQEGLKEDGRIPATNPEDSILAAFDTQYQRFLGKVDALEQRLKDHTTQVIRESETRLIRVFQTYTWGDQELAQTECGAATITSRLASLESRVAVIERRLNMPPASQTD
jgi:hypothetical protein